MTLVVDASVAIKWYVDEEGAPAALAIARGGEAMIAPDLVVAEVANVAWRKHRLGQLSAAQVSVIATHLPSAFHELVPSSRLLPAALALSLAHDAPAYDSFYLALAAAADATLVTADARLITRARERMGDVRVMPLAEFA
ncbi:MAG: type II toxin-antitoxin system VapC family toxin [Alphaproteobacteria bacterium]